MLKNILTQMSPYLREGLLVTFRTLNVREKEIFEDLHQNIQVPSSVRAFYMPPSVRFQMMYHRPAGEPQSVLDHSSEDPPDEGVVLACRKSDVDVIVNALLAKPPFAPAVDVYDEGRLLAGYVYNSIAECIADLSKVIKIYLEPDTNPKS
jgi:hypothetical protein